MEKAAVPSGGTGGSGGRKPYKKYRGNKGAAQTQPSAAAPGAPPATVNPQQSERAAEKPPKPEAKPVEKRKPTKPAAGSSTTNNTNNANNANNTNNTNNKVVQKCKILIRKLPASKDYSREQFEGCVVAVVNKLGLDVKNFHVDHFIEGKISRKRGPVFGAGYIVCSDPSQCQVFLQQCPSQVPFLLDDMNGQPEVSPAPYPKPFKGKEKVDKLAGTYESDPEFLVFKQQLENPSARSETLPSAATPQPTLEEKMRSNALLQFLREKAERRLRERSGASHSKKSSSSKESKKAKQLNAADSAKALEAKLHKREKRRENKAKRKAEAQNAAATASAGGETGTATGVKESKGKKARGRKEKKAKKLATAPSDATDGAAHQSTPQAAPPKKFTILKREAVAGQGEDMPPATVENASGKSGGGGRRGSKKRGGGGGGGGAPAPQPSEVA